MRSSDTAAASGRDGDRDEAFTRELGRIRDASAEIVSRELRIFLEYYGLGVAARKQIEDQGHPQPRTLDTRATVADRGVDADVVLPGHRGSTQEHSTCP
jgi:hypothetical protein